QIRPPKCKTGPRRLAVAKRGRRGPPGLAGHGISVEDNENRGGAGRRFLKIFLLTLATRVVKMGPQWTFRSHRVCVRSGRVQEETRDATLGHSGGLRVRDDGSR